MFVDTALKRLEMLKNWRKWVKLIAVEARKILQDAKIYVIGSIIRGDYTGGSDVDVIIVSKHVPDSMFKRAEIKARIEEALGLPYYHPFEIHLLKPEEAGYYLKRAKGYIVEI